MTTKLCRIVPLMCVLQVFVALSLSYGFNDEAHKLLSRGAVQPNVSILDNFLRTVLGFEFPNGINQTLSNGLTVEKHVEDGSVREDAGLRVRNHFHNPRLAWNQAGLGLPFTESSIVWAQNPSQLSFDKRSWQDARNYYFQALTATSDSERKRLYAETFRTLGHQIHHVQDAATPAHTRNDWHLSLDWFGGGPDPDAFHYWGETLAGQAVIGASNPPPFDTSLLNQSGANPNAPIPIARILDSTDGDIGTLALTPGISMGLAEYSSANFFSNDTINSPNFLSPRSNHVEVRTEADLSIPPKQRPYVYFKAAVGDTSYPLALASAMLPYVIDPLATPTENGLDDKVFQGYGTKLFPRAIGYSAGLIDYFFRGNIGSDVAHAGPFPVGSPPTEITVTDMVNSTPDEETGAGKMALVLKYNYQQSTTESFPQFIVSNAIPVNVTRSPQSITFPFGSLPFPATFAGYVVYSASLVYQGVLGQESGVGGSGAVVIGNTCPAGEVPVTFLHGREPDPPLGNGQPALYVGVLHGCVQ